MTKIVIGLYLLFSLITSCSSLKKQFGEVLIVDNGNALVTKQKISSIKSIKNVVFDSSVFISKQQEEIPYRLFSPTLSKTNRKVPLVVVFHGSAGIGTDNTSQLRLFQKLFVDPKIQEDYPAYVLAPQFSGRSSVYEMDTNKHVLISTPEPCLNYAIELINSLKGNPNIDTNRIYVVGYSMGASTVINSLSERPDLFAAGISISGIPQFDKIQELSDIPLWLIHGTNDSINPIDSDELLYERSNNRIRFWKLSDKTHDNIVIDDLLGDALPKWLFKHHK